MTSDPSDFSRPALKKTPLHAAHLERGARMVPFAGYEMPVQYPTGILEEHAWTRNHASLCDISHMGQAIVIADDCKHETAATALEALVPADLVGLAPGRQRYSQLLNAAGGIIDDLMVTRPEASDESGGLILILNASRMDIDCAHIARHLPKGVRIEPQSDLALLALQGPASAEVFGAICPDSRELSFMQATRTRVGPCKAFVSRSGYTGEDGFEISVAASDALTLWRTLLACEDVRPCGLGARDSLRLEAGLCLYGHELDEATSPVEAGLTWSIPKRRRASGGFPGAERILREMTGEPERVRVGLQPTGRIPARDGTEIRSKAGSKIGVITSGGYSPTLKRPIALGYISADYANVDTPVDVMVRGEPLDAKVVALPFVPHAYKRAT
ncbi:MAG: glycine cleavage system aminomethyltransferase GcvT [Hyphomicrobium sp.]|uniref:glycine cleavage system aminomethyltransferase GcvT n=1 Tax=Hyphomicrobium sp. TaxID=82 RepID=UPI0035675D70